MQKHQTALVLIDLQKESNFGLVNMDAVVKHTKRLIKACRSANIPIIYTRQINRVDNIGLSVGEPSNDDGSPFFYNSNTDQIEIIDELKPEESDIVIDKYRWSAFYETPLDLILRSLGVTELFIGGVVTDGCLMTSVFDAYFRDYNIHLIHDISSASNEGAHKSSILTMANWIYNLKVYDTENIVKKIQGGSYDCWKPAQVDSLHFTAENMDEQFQKIINKEKGE
ncbi:cysteine hydrolase [Bacillus shivajii]|uniref:cysteine hydrolase family protein n=1 Tax=Bacillus shivajii TaxID=1983719 RepID=UPI001CFA3F24|nr:isochorismatase family cysteine hydrolase [Bacillus shivajii]UCZ54431.1 cysteine hydrolase [Bacillus shivajii]